MKRAILIFASMALCVAPIPDLLAQQTNQTRGNVFAWGDNTLSQCDVPTDLTNAVAVAAGEGFSLAIRSNGQLVAWGNHPYAGLSSISNAVEIAAGSAGSMVLLADGSITTWGCGPNCTPMPPIPNGATHIAVAGGGGFVSFFAAQNDGTVYGWGQWYEAIWGSPYLSRGIVASVDCGVLHGIVLKADKKVFLVGLPNNGSGPVPTGLENISAVAAGSEYCLAVRMDGSVVGWGSGRRNGGIYPISIPESFTNVVSVAAYSGWEERYVALRSDGTLTGVGLAIPAELPFVTAASVGANHALAIVVPDKAAGPANILAHPNSQTVGAGATVFMRVNAVGFPPLRYQWYFNQTNLISGATNPTVVLTNVQSQHIGSYTVTVENPGGVVLSRTAMLNVLPLLEISLVPAVSVVGAVGGVFRLEFVNAIGSTTDWTTLATITITNNPQLYFDVSAVGQPRRFYRLSPVP